VIDQSCLSPIYPIPHPLPLATTIKKTAIFVKLTGDIFIYSTTTLTLFSGVYNATPTRPLAPGSGGSWVRDAGTGEILGQVVAASLKTCLAMITPARDFFDDIRRAPNASLKRRPPSGRGSRTRKFENIGDWCEPDPSCCTFPLSRKMGGMVRTRLRHRSVSRSLGFLGNAASEGCHLLILGSQESTRLVDKYAIVDQRPPIPQNSKEGSSSPAISSQTCRSISSPRTSLKALLLESSAITKNGS
jgi:hypothetical protein